MSSNTNTNTNDLMIQSIGRINEGIGGTRPTMRDNEQSIHQIAANDTSLAVTTPPHLVSPNTPNGYSNNDCLPYNMNGENDSELSHCRSL